jgi:hypothetical protein
MFNTDLVDDLAGEKVVLFLGAGVSASAATASGGKIAGWEAFLSNDWWLSAVDACLPSGLRNLTNGKR